jgi:hypothetical protein
MSEPAECKRGLGKVIVPSWCKLCKNDNIIKRYCDKMRKQLQENEENGDRE